MNSAAERLGFWEKCAELGANPELAAHLLSLYCLEKQALAGETESDRRPKYREQFQSKPLHEREFSFTDVFDTGIEDLPSRYGGAALGAAAGSGLGMLLGNALAGAPGIGALLGGLTAAPFADRIGRKLLTMGNR